MSRQAAIGAAVAAVLALGATAAPQNPARMASPGAACTQPISRDQARGRALDLPLAWPDQTVRLMEAIRTCGERALDVALDAYGEIAAHLKQI